MAEILEMREFKGLEIAARKNIVFKDGYWLVPSSSKRGRKYKVCIVKGNQSCGCEDFALRGETCKHIIAAQCTYEREVYAHKKGEPPEPLVIDTDVIPKRPTYKQNWPAYNLAKSTEEEKFAEMLYDLCQPFKDERGQPRTGRKRVNVSDIVFACALKVYNGHGARWTNGELKRAYNDGYISRPMHYMLICNFTREEWLTPILREMIVRTSLPLRMVEDTFAIDSTGFSVSKYVRWMDEKREAEKITRQIGKDWVKAHTFCGVKTGVVFDVNILHRNAGDNPLFAPMAQLAAMNTRMNTIVADKAYLSRDNFELAKALGVELFVPFKINSLPNDGEWYRMYCYFMSRREEFLKKYHQRSNIEAVYSSIKRRFGQLIRSKSEIGRVNEVYLKFICHNICMVHQAHIELGIDKEFWPENTDKVDVVPLTRNVDRSA